MNTQFFNPRSLSQTLELLENYKGKYIIVNGGTDIVEKLARSADCEAIVYIQGVQELKGITKEDGYIRIGGAATYSEILASDICRPFSAIIEAVSEIGSLPIRIVATPAGNIGTAVPAGDCSVALMALQANIVLASLKSERIVAASDIFVGYGRTQIQPGELIKEVRIPNLQPQTGTAFVKFAKRKAQDIAQVSAAVSLTVAGEVCQEITIALGAVGPTAIRAKSVEKVLKGVNVLEGAALIKAMVPQEASLRSPRNKSYKEAIIGIAIERAINKAYGEATGRAN